MDLSGSARTPGFPCISAILNEKEKEKTTQAVKTTPRIN
jgi:hypothetical protein